jgi:hypothetical protein
MKNCIKLKINHSKWFHKFRDIKSEEWIPILKRRFRQDQPVFAFSGAATSRNVRL